MRIPPLFRELLDDAALFPPGNAPVGRAVTAHHAHHADWFAAAVGPFLAPADRVGDLGADTGPPLRVVPIARGPEGVQAAVRAVADRPGLVLAGLEVPAPGGRVREAVTALHEHLPEGTPAAVELPRGDVTSRRLDALAATVHRAKFRTGGAHADAFPGEGELAALIGACAERRLPFKCTAGLHHAVRHRDPATGFEHHGFLNVLLAVHAAANGDRGPAVAEILAERDGRSLARAARALTDDQAKAARGLFVAFGTCSITEPLDDLVRLGLMAPAAAG